MGLEPLLRHKFLLNIQSRTSVYTRRMSDGSASHKWQSFLYRFLEFFTVDNQR